MEQQQNVTLKNSKSKAETSVFILCTYFIQEEAFEKVLVKSNWARSSTVNTIWPDRCCQKLKKKLDSSSYVNWRNWTGYNIPKICYYMYQGEESNNYGILEDFLLHLSL